MMNDTDNYAIFQYLNSVIVSKETASVNPVQPTPAKQASSSSSSSNNQPMSSGGFVQPVVSLPQLSSLTTTTSSTSSIAIQKEAVLNAPIPIRASVPSASSSAPSSSSSSSSSSNPIPYLYCICGQGFDSLQEVSPSPLFSCLNAFPDFPFYFPTGL